MALKDVTKARTNTEIPTGPMADIAFLLIVFFMLTATFSATRGLDFKLPKEDENKSIEAWESVYIKILPDESLIIDKQPMSIEAIEGYLRPILMRNAQKPVIIHTTPDAPYGRMMEVFDKMREIEDHFQDEGLIKYINISLPTEREIEQRMEILG